MAITKNYTEKETCFLALGDNASAVGWLHKSNVDETKNLPLHIAARKYAKILLEADCCLYSQHISSTNNNVADALSCRFDLTDEALSSFICSSYTLQVPNKLTIYPLPPEISSWVTSWLQKCREITESQRIQETRQLEFGDGGWSIPKSSTLNTTFGSKNAHLKEEPNHGSICSSIAKTTNFSPRQE
jgi:hypothetical protein